MHDFQIGGLVRFLGAGEGASHPAFMRIGIAVLIGDFAQSNALDADPQPRRIHHAEHAGHAGGGRTLFTWLQRFWLGTQLPGNGVVEIQHAGGLALDAHLVLDAAGIDAIARAHRAVFLDQEFRHHEEIDGREIVVDLTLFVRDLGDHHVDDVVGQVLVAARDENLGAVYPVGAVRLLDGLGLHQPKVGAAARLGQAHGTGPFARHHLGGDALLHPRRPGRQQRAIGAGRQHRIHGERLVGAHPHLADHHGEYMRHVGATRLFGRTQPAPAGFAIGFVGLLESLGRGHRTVLEVTAFLVARLVEGLQHFLTELAGIAENVVHQAGIEIGKAG